MDIKRLKILRKAKSLNQKDVAKTLGFSQQRYQFYESGRNEPDNVTLIKLADYFNVSTDYLLGNTDDPTPPDAKKEASAVFEAAEALRIYAESKVGGPLTQEELKRLDAVIDTIINGISNQGNT